MGLECLHIYSESWLLPRAHLAISGGTTCFIPSGRTIVAPSRPQTTALSIMSLQYARSFSVSIKGRITPTIVRRGSRSGSETSISLARRHSRKGQEVRHGDNVRQTDSCSQGHVSVMPGRHDSRRRILSPPEGRSSRERGSVSYARRSFVPASLERAWGVAEGICCYDRALQSFFATPQRRTLPTERKERPVPSLF